MATMPTDIPVAPSRFWLTWKEYITALVTIFLLFFGVSLVSYSSSGNPNSSSADVIFTAAQISGTLLGIYTVLFITRIIRVRRGGSDPFADRSVAGVLFSPKRAFEDVVQKPNWILPVALLTVLSMAASFAINQRINWRDFVNQQIEKSPQSANLSAEQKEQRISAGAKFAPISTYVFGTLGPVLVALIVGLIMWGAYSLLGGITTSFGTAFGITAHAFLTGLVSTPLFILILCLKPYGTADLDNPLAANLAAILPDDAAKWLVALCKSFDLFTFWTLILLAIGFAAVNPKKLKGAKSFTVAFGVWAVWVVCRVGWAFIFS